VAVFINRGKLAGRRATIRANEKSEFQSLERAAEGRENGGPGQCKLEAIARYHAALLVAR
jgi:hypothetical protein